MLAAYVNDAGTVGVTVVTDKRGEILSVHVATRPDSSAVWSPPEKLSA